MKIYVVEYGLQREQEVVAVFSSNELAKRFVDRAEAYKELIAKAKKKYPWAFEVNGGSLENQRNKEKTFEIEKRLSRNMPTLCLDPYGHSTVSCHSLDKVCNEPDWTFEL